MKSTRTIPLIAVLTALLLVASTALFADTLLADYFGVSPTLQYVDWEYTSGSHYQAYAFNPSSLTPTLHTGTADYQFRDWFGRWSTSDISVAQTYPYAPWSTQAAPAGGEPYDVEAYYFDDDLDNFYFTVITSYPSVTQGIFQEWRYHNTGVVQGDLAIDLGLSGSQTDDAGFTYNYGVDISHDVRPS